MIAPDFAAVRAKHQAADPDSAPHHQAWGHHLTQTDQTVQEHLLKILMDADELIGILKGRQVPSEGLSHAQIQQTMHQALNPLWVEVDLAIVHQQTMLTRELAAAAAAGEAHSGFETCAVTVVNVHSPALDPETLMSPQQSGSNATAAGEHLLTCRLQLLVLWSGQLAPHADVGDLGVCAEAGLDLTGWWTVDSPAAVAAATAQGMTPACRQGVPDPCLVAAKHQHCMHCRWDQHGCLRCCCWQSFWQHGLQAWWCRQLAWR